MEANPDTYSGRRGMLVRGDPEAKSIGESKSKSKAKPPSDPKILPKEREKPKPASELLKAKEEQVNRKRKQPSQSSPITINHHS